MRGELEAWTHPSHKSTYNDPINRLMKAHEQRSEQEITSANQFVKYNSLNA